jgi:penicillin-binding protein 2
MWLGVDHKAVEVVRKGMSDTVNSGGGTGGRARLSYTTLCGKTGTAQWGPPSKNQRLAWFAGFLPEDNPRYAFAVLYEGRPGEKVGGGGNAAPMVKTFFEGIKDDIKDTIAPPQRALIVVPEGEALESLPLDPAAVASLPEGSPEAPLRALPVDISELEAEMLDEEGPADFPPADFLQEEAREPKVIRAIPVSEDEIIEHALEGP